MANVNPTPTQIKSKSREESTAILKKMLVAEFGEDKVFQTGDHEFSVLWGTAPSGNEMYVNFSPKVQEFEGRKTQYRNYPVYNGKEEAEKYKAEKAEKDEKNAEKLKLKNEKIERDKKAREKQREIREQARAEKAKKKT
jgi:hypothetical protein